MRINISLFILMFIGLVVVIESIIFVDINYIFRSILFIIGIINILISLQAIYTDRINNNSQKKLSDYTIKGGE